MEEGPEVTSAKLEETKSNEKDIKNCFEFENFETPDSIDFSGDSIEKTKVKMVSDSKSVANTDVQAGQALQLTIVLIYLKNTRGKMIKKLNARMDGGDLLTLKKAKTAGICINFCVGKRFFVVLLFSGGVHEQPEEAQEIFEEELIDQICPPEVC